MLVFLQFYNTINQSPEAFVTLFLLIDPVLHRSKFLAFIWSVIISHMSSILLNHYLNTMGRLYPKPGESQFSPSKPDHPPTHNNIERKEWVLLLKARLLQQSKLAENNRKEQLEKISFDSIAMQIESIDWRRDLWFVLNP